MTGDTREPLVNTPQTWSKVPHEVGHWYHKESVVHITIGSKYHTRRPGGAVFAVPQMQCAAECGGEALPPTGLAARHCSIHPLSVMPYVGRAQYFELMILLTSDCVWCQQHETKFSSKSRCVHSDTFFSTGFKSLPPSESRPIKSAHPKVSQLSLPVI